MFVFVVNREGFVFATILSSGALVGVFFVVGK